jgi:hypothetical protein
METGLRGLAGRARLRSMRLAALAAFAVFATTLTGSAIALAGCGAVNTGQPGGGRAQLVGDLAGRLDRAGSLTYTAVYRLPQGATATVVQAQNPGRAAYVYPGGKLATTPQYLADCRTGALFTACTLTPPPSPGTDPATELIGEIADRGLIAPEMVVGLLTAAGLDTDAVVTTRDTTVAGENATCVQVKGVQHAAASDFEVCVTTGGLLGSFTGLVDGTSVDITLDRYEPTAAPDAFDLPAGAKVTDNRPK